MIPLAEPLDTSDFDLLVETALALLPNLAEEWTDYNYSDPGITLVELLAWIADSQVYSLGRNRLDERMAMAQLLGDRPRNAVPARGTLNPADPVSVPFRLAAGTRVTATGAVVPSLEAAVAVDMLPLRIAAMTVGTDAGRRDVTDINAQPGASFAAFGEPPAPEVQLEVLLEGVLPPGEARLSLGFELLHEAGEVAPELSDLRVTYLTDWAEQPLRIIDDFSAGLQRSGALILGFSSHGGNRHRLRLSNRSGALLPKIRRITVNAVPIVQQVKLRFDDATATGRPHQQLDLDLASRFASDEPVSDVAWRLSGSEPVSVEIVEGPAATSWTRCDPARALDNAKPDERVFTVREVAEAGRVEIGFGNGINGRCPPEFAPIAVSLVVSAGAGGNVLSSLEWTFSGNGLRWHNALPISGGTDPDTVATMLQRMKRRLHDDRALATTERLGQAASSLPEAFGVVRAEVVEGWEPQRRHPASAATRTLVVARRESGSETASWLAAIRTALRGRLPLGERLLVVAPDWRELRIQVVARAAQGATIAQVAAVIGEELHKRLDSDQADGARWPLGRPVTQLAVEGWLARLPGVGAIESIVLLDPAGRPLGDVPGSFARNSLPRWLPVAQDIRVTGMGAAA